MKWHWTFIGEEDTDRIRNKNGEGLEFGQVVSEYLNESEIENFEILYFNDNDEVCELLFKK